MRFTYFAFALMAASVSAQAPFLTPPEDPNNPVVAVVDGQSVRVSDVRHMLEVSPPEFVNYFKQVPQQAIGRFFMLKYLAAEGEKQKLADKSPLKEQLEVARANAIAEAMVNQERDGFNVTLDLIKNFYEHNKSRYEQAKIKIIFLRFKPGPVTPGMTPQEAAQREVERQNSKTQRSEEETQKIAEDIARQMKAGAKFEAMVAKYSDDPDSKAKGGAFDKPINIQSPYPEDLKKAVLALKAGEVSAPLHQPNGYYFVQVTERSTQPMDDVIEPIIQEIRQTHLNDYMTGLGQRFNPQIKTPDFFVKPDDYLKK